MAAFDISMTRTFVTPVTASGMPFVDGGYGPSQAQNCKFGEFNHTPTPLSNGVYFKIFDNYPLIVEPGRIHIVAERSVSVECKQIYSSKNGAIVVDGKRISIITDLDGFQHATPLINGLVIAPIIEHTHRMNKQVSTSVGELLIFTDEHGVATAYLLSDKKCELKASFRQILYVHDDIMIYGDGKSAHALDLRGDSKAQLLDISPSTFAETITGITYVTREVIPPSTYGDYLIVTIKRKPPVRCVACGGEGQLVQAALSCGHIVQIHLRCSDAIGKCACGVKPTSVIVLRRD